MTFLIDTRQKVKCSLTDFSLFQADKADHFYQRPAKTFACRVHFKLNII